MTTKSVSILSPIVAAVLAAPIGVMAAIALVLTAGTLGGCPEDPPLTLGLCRPPPLGSDLECAAHDPYFPIGQASFHKLAGNAPDGTLISCDSCHKGRETFRDALCYSCHQFDAEPVDRAHRHIAGYEPIDARCLECHPRGERGSAQGVENHSLLWFPIDPDDAHGNALFLARLGERANGCVACHASDTDRSIPLCVECHTRDGREGDGTTLLPDAHASLSAGSYIADDVACKECHADTPINPNVEPVSNHDDGLFNTNHHPEAGVTCKSCHEAYLPEPKEWGIDFSVNSCTSCHDDPACTFLSQANCPGTAVGSIP